MIGRLVSQALHNGQICPCKHCIIYSVRGQILELPFEILCTEQNQAKLAVAIINPILLKKYLLSIYLNATLLTVGLWCDGIPEKFFQKIDLFHN